MVEVGSWVEVLDWMVSREPFNIGSLRAVITVLYQAKGIAKVNVDRCRISCNKEIISDLDIGIDNRRIRTVLPQPSIQR